MQITAVTPWFQKPLILLFFSSFLTLLWPLCSQMMPSAPGPGCLLPDSHCSECSRPSSSVLTCRPKQHRLRVALLMSPHNLGPGYYYSPPPFPLISSKVVMTIRNYLIHSSAYLSRVFPTRLSSMRKEIGHLPCIVVSCLTSTLPLTWKTFNKQ